MSLRTVFSLLAIYVSSGQSAQSASLECGACALLINQFEIRIAKVDPKKTIEVGSFRVSPDGQQKGLKEVSYTRSESHLTEIIEDVCDESRNYKHVVNALTGKLVYVHNDATYLKGDDSSKMRSKLQSACNDFVDTHEDELIKFLKTAHDDPVKQFCHNTLRVCSSVDVSPLPPNDPPKEEEPMTLADIPQDEL